jgi:proteasome lid subunit RPN8/RPN11
MPRVQAAPETYRFRLEFFDTQRRRVHELALTTADFHRAIEDTFFAGLRQGVFTEYDPRASEAILTPRFTKATEGIPGVERFEVALPTPDGGLHRKSFDRGFFHSLVRRTGAQLVTAGKVLEGGTVLFQLAAYRDDAEPAASGWGMELEAETPEIPLVAGSRKEFGAARAWDAPNPDDFPVLIPQHVVEEAVEEAKHAPEREVGGVLLGRLRRDDQTRELFLEVTCLVPAEQTEATEMSVTFTHATWARVREVIDVRGEKEMFVGWMHSHPFRFCAECPLPVPKECMDKVLFYSSDDEFLMELSFARPFMVGLLAAVEPRLETVLGHLPVKLYGWKDGRIEARGFEVIEG